jgi:hypothetical protein
MDYGKQPGRGGAFAPTASNDRQRSGIGRKQVGDQQRASFRPGS